MSDHWTDNMPSPVFTTRIWAGGSGGNVHAILANALAYLGVIGIPRDRRDALRAQVEGAASYKEAVGAIERWFAVDGIAPEDRP